MIELTEPQVWTLIGVFAAVMIGGQTLVMSVLKARLDTFGTRMDAGFEAINKRIDYLDRDVQFLMRKEFGENPNA